jgi:hypothetical protein
MGWLEKQPRYTKIFVYVTSQLNDIGIRPNGAEIKPWVKQEMLDLGITADHTEIAMILSGMLKEGAITQADIDRVQNAAKVL